MRKAVALIWLATVLLFAGRVNAQNSVGQISASSAACATASSCVTLQLTSGAGSALVQLTTFVGTMQFEGLPATGAAWVSISGTPQPSGTAVSSATAAGTWAFNVGAYRSIRVRCSAYTSGTPTAYINASPAAAQSRGASGGGGTLTGSGTANDVAIWTAGTALGNSAHLSESTNAVALAAGDLNIASGTAAESLTNGALTSGTGWTRTGDFALTANAATYTDSTHAGTFQQASGTLAVAGVANKSYQFTYTTSAVSGDVACTITTAFASAATSLTMPNGTYTVNFQAAASPGNFVISCTSGSGAATFDSLSLKQATGNLSLASMTAGSIPFFNPGGVLAQAPADLLWDANIKALGIGKHPTATLDVVTSDATNPAGLGFDLAVNSQLDQEYPLGQRITVSAAPTTGLNSGDVEGLRVDASVSSLGTADNISVLQLFSTNTSGVPATNAQALWIHDITGATNNYAIKTGLGQVDLGDTLKAAVMLPKYSVSKLAQVAAITTTVITTVGASDAQFTIEVASNCTTSSAAATYTVTYSWTDTSNTALSVAPTTTCTTLTIGGSTLSSIRTFRAKAGTDITYAVSIVNTPTFDLSIALDQRSVN